MPGVTTLRPFLFGVVSAAVLVVIVLYAEGYHRPSLYWLLPVPLVLLHVAAVFVPVDGWLTRLARDALGSAVAAGCGYLVFLLLRVGTDWFAGLDGPWGGPVVVLHAALPGGAAAGADSPRRGLALAGGFTSALAAAHMLARYNRPGFAVLLVVGACVGAVVGGLVRRHARR